MFMCDSKDTNLVHMHVEHSEKGVWVTLDTLGLDGGTDSWLGEDEFRQVM